MDRFTKHTVLFLALLFLVAQGMQSLHFFIFHFDNNNFNSIGHGFSFSNEELHQCDFVYYKIPLSFKSFNSPDEKQEFLTFEENHLVFKNISKKQYKLTKFLRGPPVVFI